MTAPATWVHDLDPFLVRFPEGFPLEGIRYYGLAYLLGFVGAFVFVRLAAKRGRSPLPGRDAELDLFTYLIAGVLVGGRLGYVLLYDFPRLVENPLSLFAVWQGGMASHGGFIGVGLALFAFSLRRRISFWRLSDLLTAIAPLGLLLGRLANFINGELWGRPSKVAWAVLFPDSPPDPATGVPEPRHPSQLYQAFAEGFVLLAWLQWRFWRNPAPRPGRLTGEFLVLYALGRIATEFFREPDASLILGLSRGQFYSLFLIPLGIAIWLYAGRGHKPRPDAGQTT